MKALIRFLFIILLSFVVTACHEKDYNIIDEAKKLILNTKNLEDNEENENLVIEKNILKENKLETNNKRNNKKIEKKKDKPEEKKSRIIKPTEKKIIKDTEDVNNTFNKIEPIKKPIEATKRKIGVMLPLSGSDKEIGNLILNALEIALFQDIKSDLELIIKDTKADPDTARKKFLELKEENVSFIVGPLFSKTLSAIENKVEADNFSIFALTNNKNLAKRGVWIFGVDPQEQTNRILNFAMDKGHKKISALLPRSAYGLLLFETISNFSRDNDLELIKIEFYENNIDSQREASRRLSKGFDAYQEYLDSQKEKEFDDIEIDAEVIELPFDSVFIAASGQTLTVLASQLQYNNVDPKLTSFLGISSWEDKSILSEPALEGGFFTNTSKKYQEDIKNIYRSSFKKEMPKVAMIAYDVLALLNSLDINDFKNYNVETLVNNQGYIGLRGLFRLKKNGIVERIFDINQIKKKKFITYEKAGNSFSIE